MARKLLLRNTAARLTLIAVAAASTIAGASGSASASTGGQITVCAHNAYWSQVWFQAADRRPVGGIWTAPGTCSTKTVPSGGNGGWAMHVQEGNNGDNLDFGVVAFVAEGTTGSNYHIDTYGWTDTTKSYSLYEG